ncbi:hypothetical protein CYMTET_53122 [Cymbomonas tetramitiformis]|uniref:Transposable element P transposase-like RNase H C-terminal domain-containing protein n=1 Tax=Cymbomonas tetramitiformis TaxID=36881 RepID=A0AAE0ES21_9CHLO|nr:hypothetical protein CYMTET_53122 [Cymbomonas tetramitiformis]
MRRLEEFFTNWRDEAEDNLDCFITHETMFDLQLTIDGFFGFMREMFHTEGEIGIKPRRLNSDPLENFFGGLRGAGGQSSNPTAVRLPYLIQQQITSRPLKRAARRRLTDGVVEAVEWNQLDREALKSLNAYSPSLSSAWMFQKAMSVPVGGRPPPQLINSILGTNFATMENLGDPVLRPFLQDVVQWTPLARTLLGMMVSAPQLLPSILLSVGALPIADWLRHFIALGAYDLLFRAAQPFEGAVEGIADDSERFKWKRRLEAWKYGSGNDY